MFNDIDIRIIKFLSEIDPSFCDFLKDNKAVIAGSFIISQIYNDFKFNDIDIFVIKDDFKYIPQDISYITNINYNYYNYYKIGNKSPFNNKEILDYNNIPVADVKYFIYNKDINKTIINLIYVYNYDDFIKKTKRNYIINRYDNIIDYIIESFDLSLCTIMFDGNKLIIPKYIENNDIINKQMFLINCYNFINHHRNEKYISRGFNIDIDRSILFNITRKITEIKNGKLIKINIPLSVICCQINSKVHIKNMMSHVTRIMYDYIINLNEENKNMNYQLLKERNSIILNNSILHKDIIIHILLPYLE